MKRFLAKIIFKLYLATKEKKNWIKGTDIVFHLNGHNYHRYKNSGDIPVDRLERLQSLVMMLKNRIDEDEFDLLTSIIEDSAQTAMDGLNRTGKMSGLQNISFAIQEMKSRKEDLMFHPNLMFKIAAVMIIRDDEDPYKVNDLLINEKFELFKAQANHIDFFLQAGLGEFLPNSTELLHASNQQLKNLKEQYRLTQELVEKKMEAYKKIAGRTRSIPMEKV
jgi:hypothetical protein